MSISRVQKCSKIIMISQAVDKLEDSFTDIYQTVSVEEESNQFWIKLKKVSDKLEILMTCM